MHYIAQISVSHSTCKGDRLLRTVDIHGSHRKFTYSLFPAKLSLFCKEIIFFLETNNISPFQEYTRPPAVIIQEIKLSEK